MNLDHLRTRAFAPIVQRYDVRDSALYAISLGMGQDPLDEDELPYVYEGARTARCPKPCASTLCWPPFWHKEPETGIAWRRLLHGEQSFSLLRPLAADGEARAEHRISAVEDKGAGRGAGDPHGERHLRLHDGSGLWPGCGRRNSRATMAASAGSGRRRR